MITVLEAVSGAIRSVDPALGDRFSLPVKPDDHIIGTLDDEAQRIVALLTMAYEQNGENILKHDQLVASGYITDEQADNWIVESRAVRARIFLLKALLLLAAANQFPGCLLCDYIIVRSGFVLVWREKDDPEENLIAKAMSVALREPFSFS